MRYLACTATGVPQLGDDEGFVPLSAAYPDATSVRDALPEAPGGLVDPAEAPAGRVPRKNLSLGSVLPDPGKLFGIGLNYAEHAADLSEEAPDEPASFFKPSTAATGPGGPIRLPPADISDRVTAEAELAVVVGKTCRNVSVEEADEVIAGYMPVIDMTAEDILQRNPRFLTRSKSFDSFIVLGPHLAVPRPGMDLADIEVRTVVNGEVTARNVVDNMHFSPRELVAFHSDVMTLEPGDVISTGTPGAEPIDPGDHVRAEIDAFGAVEADVVR
ncbi:fumarylacetoacetate hydrolase family protein [Haloplanus aerogenes]|uniref:2-keto-4-pentenoate hydratase/2-oxohepta-3-ene-1,7-dioic acid hydratase in catechol pathway n=1 Tax=Haloplanus aerogenes TaxID=660522 RepID=A0A3M0DFF6_9EURY|nr:fumarylacetoacetate hydrolase family protein [Haloplanus aerogenes]AZH26396.1 FAA hydrolase family protein [Haloplanus aerogenes]RMB18139.1 2-keto-4-pentenoate hydratase/2-oxohepta-3-ene-1,7-dioic acid hydratase in catechol pathway [Haloplanus aerogenes]